MPIYEYRRPDGTTFEIQQTFAEDALRKDPETGVPVERVLHAPAVHFKGKGFYNTDYGTRNRNRETAANTADNSSKKESSSKDSSASKDSSGGDSKSSSSEGKSKGEKSSTGSGGSKDSKSVAAKG